MTKKFWLVALVLLCTASPTVAQQKEESAVERVLGTWTGTWEGSDSGTLEMTFEKGEQGLPTGRIIVSGPTSYSAALTQVKVTGDAWQLQYDFPDDPNVQVVMAATLDAAGAKGTWSARQKADGAEVLTGTWKASRKSP